MDKRVSEFGRTANGEQVDAICLTNDGGIAANLLSYGATLATLELPGSDGEVRDCVLGYDTLAEYEQSKSYFGATVGRCASFIKAGRFQLNGAEYSLTTNFGAHHIHGGAKGFSHCVWQWDTWHRAESVGVIFTLVSPHGDEGYPGEVSAAVSYSLNNRNELRIDYTATTDRPTHVNMTNHAYFNLAGHDSGNIRNHELKIASRQVLAIDDQLIPTGRFLNVEDTPFDFRRDKAVGSDLGRAPFLYDHTFLCESGQAQLPSIAKVRDLNSGRGLEVFTTEPAVHLYTAAHLDDEPGKRGAIYGAEQGLCLETQHFPNSPNRPEFPTTVLNPGDRYHSTTVYRFSVRR